jgi:hypothetical protein
MGEQNSVTEPSLDAFKELLVRLETRPVEEKQCKFAKWHENLSPEKAEVISVLLSSNLTHAELFRELQRVMTIQMSRDTIRNHRQGQCACR